MRFGYSGGVRSQVMGAGYGRGKWSDVVEVDAAKDGSSCAV